MKTILLSVLVLSIGGCAFLTDPYYGETSWSAERKARANSINRAGRALAAQGLTSIPPAPGQMGTPSATPFSPGFRCTTTDMPLYSYTDCY